MNRLLVYVKDLRWFYYSGGMIDNIEKLSTFDREAVQMGPVFNVIHQVGHTPKAEADMEGSDDRSQDGQVIVRREPNDSEADQAEGVIEVFRLVRGDFL